MPPEGQDNNSQGFPAPEAPAAEHATDDIGLDLTGLSGDDQKLLQDLSTLDEAGMADHITSASPEDREALEQMLANLDPGAASELPPEGTTAAPPPVPEVLPTTTDAPLPPPTPAPAPAPAPAVADPFAALVAMEQQRAARDAAHQQQLTALVDTMRLQQEPAIPDPMQDPAGYAQALVQQQAQQNQTQVQALEGRLQEMTDALQGLALQQRATASRSQMQGSFDDYDEVVAPVDKIASQDAYLSNALSGAQHQGEWKYLIGLGIRAYQERLAGGAAPTPAAAPGLAPAPAPAGAPAGLAGNLVGALGRIKPRLDQAGGTSPGGDADLGSMDVRDLADWYRKQNKDKRKRSLREAG